MSDSTTVRGSSPELGTHLDDEVPGHKTFSERDKQQQEETRPDRDFEPVSEDEFYEGAERAKADFAQAAGGDTPEPTGDEHVPPAQKRAQERVSRERH